MHAVQRVFFYVCGWVFGPAVVCAGYYLWRSEFKNASIAAGVATAAFVYWMAFYTRRDLR